MIQRGEPECPWRKVHARKDQHGNSGNIMEVAYLMRSKTWFEENLLQENLGFLPSSPQEYQASHWQHAISDQPWLSRC